MYVSLPKESVCPDGYDLGVFKDQRSFEDSRLHMSINMEILIIYRFCFKCGRAMLRHEWAGSTGVLPRPHRKTRNSTYVVLKTMTDDSDDDQRLHEISRNGANNEQYTISTGDYLFKDILVDCAIGSQSVPICACCLAFVVDRFHSFRYKKGKPIPEGKWSWKENSSRIAQNSKP
uniref:SFRICE_001179 n=1 Tax=Spodoptera frugiperda TaxID=7108 RepID=A0A2H1VVT6_SPOFR